MTVPSESIEHSTTALLVIDVQMAFVHRDESGAARITPLAENNIRRLLERFRTAGGKTIHIHHHSHQEGSPFTAGLPGAVVQEFATPAKGEAVYIKHVNSSFIGTSLEADLRRDGFEHLILCGATVNQCVETTARMAGNLGFDTLFVADGVWAYGSTGPDGRKHGAEDILYIIISNLHGKFATVLSTDEVFDLLNG